MSLKKSPVGVVLFLLLVLFINNQGDHTFISSGIPTFDIHQYSSVKNVAGSGVAVNYPSIKKDWIKVRYMAGEYNFTVPFVALIEQPVVFAQRVQATKYTAYISLKHLFLLKLRGPPSLC